MAWKEIESNIWKPEAGEALVGVYLEKETHEGAHSAIYYLNTKHKGTVGVWGCSMLDSKLGQVDKGEVVRITYNGKTKNSKGQEMHDYKVEQYEKDVIPESDYP